ncbi:PucR family transcriptional regulator [Sporosarcina sp. G11-34]|uniref:PucR family transcriptional regulator n=1 Tax=Sporosarcina sp. G11-34 TaxID=2849605 RepID=UPI0022A986A4|nr:PucR family transcriptional regulator [Sporosarcina sp. G11-34]MCZ2257827.1 PucR family transcriptional regulator [Sporosarcina sp. G11-34]
MITVKDSLRLPELQNVIIRSGISGVARKIRWVHVVDHDDIAHFLKGQEFLLSSGQLWPKDKEVEAKFLDSLLRHQISGILLATGRYLLSCPPALLEFGEKYSIPVLEVPFKVPFVQITYAIHEEIMERQYHKRILTNHVPTKFFEMMHTVKSSQEICDVLADFLKCTAVFTDKTNSILEHATFGKVKRIDISPTMNHLITKLKKEYTQDKQHNKRKFGKYHAIYLKHYQSYVLAVPLNIEETFYGTLWLLQDKERFTQDHELVLKHAAQILIDIHIDKQEAHVKRWQIQSEMLDLLLEKQKTAKLVVEKKIWEIGLLPKGQWMAGLILTGNRNLSSQTLLELATIRGVCNKWFEEELEIDGFCEVYGDNLVLLMTTFLDSAKLKLQLASLRTNLLTLNDQVSPVFVIGSFQRELLSFVSSYESAKSLAPLVQYKNESDGTYFSDQFQREILLYGKMTPAEAHYLLTKLLPDKSLREDGEILYETLKSLAANSFNREYVAKTLHIHRNTLRYRIKKIEEFLQDNLASPDCQFWIQTALNIQSLAHQHKPE